MICPVFLGLCIATKKGAAKKKKNYKIFPANLIFFFVCTFSFFLFAFLLFSFLPASWLDGCELRQMQLVAQAIGQSLGENEELVIACVLPFDSQVSPTMKQRHPP